MWFDLDVQEAMMMTVDRNNWRRFVASPYTVLADHESEGGGEGRGGPLVV